MLAKNQRKTQDKHPDYTGQANIDGKEVWISGWIKEGKEGGKMAGQKFFSLSFQSKDARTAAAPSKPATASNSADEVPF